VFVVEEMPVALGGGQIRFTYAGVAGGLIRSKRAAIVARLVMEPSS